jgi:hypothetical protein
MTMYGSVEVTLLPNTMTPEEWKQFIKEERQAIMRMDREREQLVGAGIVDDEDDE